MSKAKPDWTMPAELEPYRSYIVNTGGNSVEDLMSRDPREANIIINAPVALLCVAVKSQVALLNNLCQARLLRPPAGMPKHVEALIDDLKALSTGTNGKVSLTLLEAIGALREAYPDKD